MYFITDWTKRVDFDKLRRERVARLRQKMAEHNLDAVLALKYENCRYASGLRPLWFPITMMRSAAIVTRASEEIIVFVTSGDWEHRRATMTWLDPENVRPLINYQLEEPETMLKGLAGIQQAFEELGATRGRIGVDQLTFPFLDGLRRILPAADLVDGDACFRDARLVKNPEEIKAFKMACECVDIAFDAAIRAVETGRRECEVLGEAMRVLYNLGMEAWQCSSIVASGDNLAPLCRFGSDRIIQHGDLVFMDFGGCFNGLFAEATRTVANGRPNKEQKRIYRAVYDALEAIKSTVRPGVTGTAVCEAVSRTYTQHGFDGMALLGPIGHSIGIAGLEPPTLGPSAMIGKEFTLGPGMIFSFEPTIVVPGILGGGGVRLEDEILVTEDGCQVLTRSPYDERLLE